MSILSLNNWPTLGGINLEHQRKHSWSEPPCVSVLKKQNMILVRLFIRRWDTPCLLTFRFCSEPQALGFHVGETRAGGAQGMVETLSNGQVFRCPGRTGQIGSRTFWATTAFCHQKTCRDPVVCSGCAYLCDQLQAGTVSWFA